MADIPLLPGLFKLIGFGYSLWFGNRYLLRATDRRELATKIEAVKTETIGTAPAASVPVAALPATQSTESVAPERLFAGVVGTMQVLIPLTGVVDVDALKAKLQRSLAKVEAEISALSARLSNASFVDKAPADVVAGARAALAEAEAQAEILRDRLARL
jgi:valyl-tRNA synthetase